MVNRDYAQLLLLIMRNNWSMMNQGGIQLIHVYLEKMAIIWSMSGCVRV